MIVKVLPSGKMIKQIDKFTRFVSALDKMEELQNSHPGEMFILLLYPQDRRIALFLNPNFCETEPR